jgi:hypothetical protein
MAEIRVLINSPQRFTVINGDSIENTAIRNAVRVKLASRRDWPKSHSGRTSSSGRVMEEAKGKQMPDGKHMTITRQGRFSAADSSDRWLRTHYTQGA